MIDHHERARRVKAIIESDRSTRDWSLGGAEESQIIEHSYPTYTLDGEIPCVPFRYVVEQWTDEGRTLMPLDSYEDGVVEVDEEDGNPHQLYDLDEGRVYAVQSVHKVDRVGERMWQDKEASCS